MWDASSDTPRRPHWRGDFGVSWTDPADWHSFEEAVKAAEEHESWGIGYVLANGNEDYPRGLYGGLDLDRCVADGGGPKDWLPSLKPFLDAGAYVEFSPSGDGLHIPLVGFEEPDWWTDIALGEHEGIEAYDKKFFAFTGDMLDDCGDEVMEDRGQAEEWLKTACEDLTGERPWDDDDDEKAVTAPSSSVASGNAEEIARAVDALDARDVAEKTIVHGWNDDASTSGDNRAFYPTWGPNCNGTANIVDRDGWVDTGTDSGSGGPLEMAAIDMGELRHSGCSWGDVSGELWWDAVDHLRDLGFRIPEYEGTDANGVPPEAQEEASSDGEAAGDQSPSDGDDPDWERIRSLYADGDTDTKYPRKMAADVILNGNTLATPRDTERLWEYHAPTGTFEKGGEATVDEILARNLGAHYSQRERNEIIGNIKARTYIDRDEFNGGEDERLLCVSNGVLDLETRELMDHSPDYYFIRALPVEYDPDAKPTAIEEFLSDVTEREADEKTMLEMVGSCLWPSYLKGKFMILFGEGGNGKTVFFDLVSQFLASENVSGWDLQKLGNNRFSTSALVGKFANIGGDMDSVKVKNTGVLKTLTGGDVMMVEQKNEPAHEFVNSATLMFGANRPPVIDEASRAVKRRLVPIRLPYEFTDDEDELEENDSARLARDDDELLDEMTEDEELSGLLNLALDGLDRLRENGDVSLPESQEERLEYYEQFSDPIKEFAVRCLDNDRGKRVEKDAVYSAYKSFCADRDYTNRQKSTFYRQLARTTFDVNSVRAGSDGERTQVLDNATFTDVGRGYAPDYGTGVADGTSDSESGDEDDEAALENISKGFASVTVTVAEILEPPEWLQGKGHIVDDEGNIIPYECEGADPIGASGVEEGDKIHLDRAKFRETSEGMTAVLSGVTCAENLTASEDQSGLDDQQAAADGGETMDELSPPSDAEGPRADIQRLLQVLDGAGTLSKHEIANQAKAEHDMNVGRTFKLLEKAANEGAAIEKLDGDEYRRL